MLFVFRASLIFTALLADMTFFGRWSDMWVFPGATALLVASWTMVLGFSESIGWVLFAGCMADMLLFALPGFFTALFVLIAYATDGIVKRVAVGRWMRIGLVFFEVLFVSLLIKTLFIGISLDFFTAREYVTATFFESGWYQIGALFSGLGIFWIGYGGLRRIENFFSFYTARIHPTTRRL